MYANRTKVPQDRTRSEIERLLEHRGATAFAYGNTDGKVMLAFEMSGRRLRFVVPMPMKPKRSEHERKVAAEIRRRWRALLLVLKAKLEAVESQIVSFDTEFLAHIVVEGNDTVGDRIIPGLHASIAAGKGLPPLLGSGT